MNKEEQVFLVFDVIGTNGKIGRFLDNGCGEKQAIDLAVENLNLKPSIIRTCIDATTGEDEYYEAWYSRADVLKVAEERRTDKNEILSIKSTK